MSLLTVFLLGSIFQASCAKIFVSQHLASNFMSDTITGHSEEDNLKHWTIVLRYLARKVSPARLIPGLRLFTWLGVHAPLIRVWGTHHVSLKVILRRPSRSIFAWESSCLSRDRSSTMACKRGIFSFSCEMATSGPAMA
jgi:hypothetical protein